jgi:pimeloyl-ACP methyl ester carboxylesterase
MPKDKINNINIFWESTGDEGEPLILVHGSWSDHHNWDLVNHLNLFPAHLVGSSYGASIVLKTAAKRPDLFISTIIHEPPLFGLLKDDPDAQEALQKVNVRIKAVADLIMAGDKEMATREFIEKIAMGPGAWEKLHDDVKRTFIYNAPTWYDEINDPQSLQVDLTTLSAFKKPVLLTTGSESPPFFPLVIEKLMNVIPQAKRITIKGAGHVPQTSHSEKYTELVKQFCLKGKVE